jgi:glutamate-1-semialdehyde 2,1-aminomutase
VIDDFTRSVALLERALLTIPLGAQTFSKSMTQFPHNVSPYFAARGKGATLVDVDGNEYLDFVNALASVLLGYADDEVNAAVRAQLEHGVTFSLSHELEIEVAERLCRLIPCAEQVRFGKNGSDATAAAVRLARAATGRERIATCGYHGWQDWYIGTTTRDLGVPAAVKALTSTFRYNDSGSLEALLTNHPGEFAAVILEPLGADEPRDGFLETVAALTRADGALLVFDETVTGFRVHLGGAQAATGVTPDLATLGKGLANGFPLSAIVGSRRHMKLMEDIFFSTTFGGETLSLAAARATIDRLERDRIPDRLATLGTRLRDGVLRLAVDSGCGDVFAISGHPSWTFLRIAPTDRASAAEIKTLLLQELFARGILFLGTHNLSAAHDEADIDRLLGCYRELLPWLAELARAGRVRAALRTEPLTPLFTVR